jgi:Tol biopolymer transport system component
MPERDDDLRRALLRAAPRGTSDGVREAIRRKRHRRQFRRRTTSGVLAVAVVAGTVGGFLTVRRTVGSADGPEGVIAFSRTLRSCFHQPNVGGPQVDAFAVTPDGATEWNLTDEARYRNDRGRAEEQLTFAPDGTAFAWIDGYESRLLVTDVATGDTRGLARGAAQPDFAPDGQTIVYEHGKGIWSVPLVGGNPTELTDQGFAPVWSPDGDTIAFLRSDDRVLEISTDTDVAQLEARSRQSLWFMAPDGTAQREMEVQPDDADWSVVEGDWASDGDRFAVEVRFGNNHDLVVVNVDSRTGVRLTDHPAADTSPTWSPDGSKIAFSTGRWGSGVGHSEIATIGADGLDLVRVTDDCWDDFSPDWVSSDGAIRATPPWTPPPAPDLGPPGAAVAGDIVYGTSVEGVEDLYAIDPTSGTTTNLTADLVSQGGPRWSPDRTLIAYWSYDQRTSEAGVYVRPAAGGAERLIVPDGGAFDWMPDGKALAVSIDGRLAVVPIDGGPAIGTGFDRVEDLSISSNGRAVATIQVGSRRDPRWELAVLDLDEGTTTSLAPGSEMDHGARWSPDATRIAFTRGRDVYVVGADGSGLVNLTPGHGDAYDRDPAWSPDGNRIVFASSRGSGHGALRLFVMDADGTDLERISGLLGHCCPNPDW